MKLVIERALLLKSLNHVQSVVEKRNTIPILSNVKIEGSNGKLSLNATDLDIEILESVAADIVSPGAITTSAHTLYEIVRKLPDGSDVEIAYDEGAGQIGLRSGRSKFSLPSLSAEDFPALSQTETPFNFTLTAEEMQKLVDKTRFAISNEETRYYLNGIFLHVAETEKGQMLRSVATDGHRLARFETACPEGAKGIPGIIIPRKTVTELRKLLDEASTKISVSLSDSRIRFSFDNVILSSKLIDGSFPDYDRVIPVGNDRMLEVDVRAFAQAVDRVSAISSEKSRAIKLRMENDVLTLSATSTEAGSAVEELEASYQSPVTEIGFNARYLLDILGQIEGDMALFALADSSSPVLVREISDGGAVYVLMPMRV